MATDAEVNLNEAALKKAEAAFLSSNLTPQESLRTAIEAYLSHAARASGDGEGWIRKAAEEIIDDIASAQTVIHGIDPRNTTAYRETRESVIQEVIDSISRHAPTPEAAER